MSALTPLSGHAVASAFRQNGLFTRAYKLYSTEVHDHFSNPRNVGSLDKKDPNVGTAVVGKAACGDVIKLQVQVKNDIIQDVKFKTFGCGSAIASSSYASELIKGRTTEEALAIKNTDIAHELKLPPVKLHCSLLAEDAIKHAIEDYRRKRIVSETAAAE
eukprot:GHVO01046402.1.p1 GENE.GHVO01046402.1~~GHVO01046402.1.p1  ORF type:complete len:160 (+),score=22.06 GHVO01046402.1:181-660(+)